MSFGILKPHLTSKANAAARANGVVVAGVALAATSTPFATATVSAFKPGANALTAPTANTGDVYVGTSTGSIQAATKLAKGEELTLPGEGDLSLYFLSVDNANDGVLIRYTV